MTACTATLDTVELLENILLYLPLQKLLLSQRVNKQWQSVVQGSHKARRALFLQQTSDTKLEHYEFDTEAFCTEEGLVWQGKILINPLIKNFGSHVCRRVFFSDSFFGNDEAEEDYDGRYSQPWAKDFESQAEFAGCKMAKNSSGGSWKDMAVFFPPVRSANPVCEEHIWTRLGLEDLATTSQQGITLGDLAAILSSERSECDACMDDAQDHYSARGDISWWLEKGPGVSFERRTCMRELKAKITGWDMLAAMNKAAEGKPHTQAEMSDPDFDAGFWDESDDDGEASDLR
ncbi:hypothetical protein LTR15_008304 [Elasticomyces elasticus]|nr:hypothetical protein LTR15_008304 [Elasticomyces elasticus]